MKSSKQINGTISFCMAVPLPYIIFDIVNRFKEKYPKVEFNISVGNRLHQIQLLKDNKVDFCLMMNTGSKINFSSKLIAQFPMSLFVLSKHPFTYNRRCSYKALLNETFIIGEDESANHTQTIALFKKFKIKNPKTINIENQEAIKQAVRANMGIAFLAKFMVQLEASKKPLVPVSIENFSTLMSNLYWVQNNNKFSSPTIIAFRKFLTSKIRQLFF